MKISEIIEKLQEDLEIHGDLDVVYQCDCFDCDCFDIPDGGMFDIGGVGWFSDVQKDEKKIQLICAECHHAAHLDHIHGKYGYQISKNRRITVEMMWAKTGYAQVAGSEEPF